MRGPESDPQRPEVRIGDRVYRLVEHSHDIVAFRYREAALDERTLRIGERLADHEVVVLWQLPGWIDPASTRLTREDYRRIIDERAEVVWRMLTGDPVQWAEVDRVVRETETTGEVLELRAARPEAA